MSCHTSQEVEAALRAVGANAFLPKELVPENLRRAGRTTHPPAASTLRGAPWALYDDLLAGYGVLTVASQWPYITVPCTLFS